MRRWDRLVDLYIEQYRARGISDATIGNTLARLERWGGWLKQRRPRVSIERIEADLITRYIASCASFRAKATVYGAISTLRGFGDFLVGQGLWSVNPLRWMKGPKMSPYSRMPQRIAQEHMHALWAHAARLGGGYSTQLWVTVLAMLYGTGLRRGELERLDIDAFDRSHGTLRIDGRKTGRERNVPLPGLAQRCLEAYLPMRHNQLERMGRLGERGLFVSRNGRRLTGTSISIRVHAIARRAGVPLHSLHQFRHTCASDLLEAGVHVAEVQKILGHSVISTTARYLQIADPQRQAAIAMHPLNDWLQPQPQLEREAA